MTSLIHTIASNGDMSAVFEACRNVALWPRFMPAVRAARFVQEGSDRDIVEITAEVNENIWTWQSRRVIRPREHTIDFERIAPPAGVLHMRGTWCVRHADSGVEIALSHDFDVEQGKTELLAFLMKSIMSNTRRDLEALAKYTAPVGNIN